MRVSGVTIYPNKSVRGNHFSYNDNIKFLGKQRKTGFSNFACSILFTLPFVFSYAPLKAQNNSDEYINIQIGEKGNRKDLNYYKNKKYDYSDSAIFANGKIDNFKQGETPDCALLSSIKAVSLTPEGKQIMKSIIKPLPEGSFQVEICDDSDSNFYKVTRKDFFAPENKNLSTLDDDVKILEIGFKKYCALQQEKSSIDSFSSTKALKLLTCASPDYSINTGDNKKAFIEAVGDSKVINPNISSIYDLFDRLLGLDREKSKHSVFVCATKDENLKYGLFKNHSYYVTNIKLKKIADNLFDGLFELKNPHNTDEKPIKLTLKQFLESMKNIDYIELNSSNVGFNNIKNNMKFFAFHR